MLSLVSLLSLVFFLYVLWEFGEKVTSVACCVTFSWKQNFPSKFLALRKSYWRGKQRIQLLKGKGQSEAWRNESVQVIKGYLKTVSESPAKQSHSLDFQGCGSLNFRWHCLGSQVGKLPAFCVYAVFRHQGLHWIPLLDVMLFMKNSGG